MLRKFYSLVWVLRNVWQAQRLRPMRVVRIGNIVYRPCRLSDFSAVIAEYEKYFGASPNRAAALVYRLCYRRLVHVGVDAKTDQLLAYTLYYFADRDFTENTVHNVFHYVAPSLRGREMGMDLVILSLEAIAASGFSGLSARISVANGPVVAMVKKLAGTRFKETFHDPELNEDRYYITIQHSPAEFKAVMKRAQKRRPSTVRHYGLAPPNAQRY